MSGRGYKASAYSRADFFNPPNVDEADAMSRNRAQRQGEGSD